MKELYDDHNKLADESHRITENIKK